MFVVAKIRSESSSSSQRLKSGKQNAHRDTLTLKELIEAKIPEKEQTALVSKSTTERKEEAISKAKEHKKKKHNQILPGPPKPSTPTGMTPYSLSLPPISPSPDGAGAMETYRPPEEASLSSPRVTSRSKMKAAANKLRGAELLVRTSKMPAGIPMNASARPAVLTSTEKDLVKAIKKGQKGPQRKRKIAKGNGMAATITEEPLMTASGVRKLQPKKKVTKGSGV